ncbi:MAG: L-fuculose-phosphate aldolase [Anaerolineaceae bacterium]
MRLVEERKAVVKYGKKLISSQLTTGTGGNLSIYNRAEGLVAIKPSGMDYCEISDEDIVVVDLEGKIVEGNLRPSSEIQLHLGLYNCREDVNAVVHTHQVYATTIACLNWELPAIHYLVGFSGTKVPLAPYATYGSRELADNVVHTIGEYNACLMANHGLITVGSTLTSAFAAAEEIELVSRLYYQAKCIGSPVILPDDEITKVMKKFNTYGNV